MSSGRAEQPANTTTEGITWELLREVFPVPNSDRRTCSDLFQSLVDASRIKDDSAFYPALLERIETDTAFLRALDARYFESDRTKDRKKSFTQRAIRWLRQRGGVTATVSELMSNNGLYEPGSSAHAIQGLLLRAILSPDLSRDDGAVVQVSWGDRLDELRQLVANFTVPEASDTAEILTCAEALHKTAQAYLQAQEAGATRAAVGALESLRNLLRDALEGATELEGVSGLLEQVRVAQELPPELGPSAAELSNLSAELASTLREIAGRKTELEAKSSSGDWARVKSVAEALEIAECSCEDIRSRRTSIVAQIRQRLDLISSPPRSVPPAVATDVVAAEGLAVDAPKHPVESTFVVEELVPTRAEEPTVPAAVGAPLGSPVLSAEPVDRPIGSSQSESVSISDDLLPKSTVSDESVDSRIAFYLANSEYAFAWHLSYLAEERGLTPLVSSKILKALAASPCVTGPYEAASPYVTQLLAEASTELALTVADEKRHERTKALYFAALLRPALLASETSARQHLGNLSYSGGIAAFAQLGHAISELGHDFQPRLEDLRELGGARRQRRTPAAENGVRQWLAQARNSQSVHQPTTVILHEILARDGRFGRVFESVLSTAPDRASAHDLVDNYLEDRPALERLVAECERAYGRPKGDRIRGMALDWICRKLNDGCEHLKDWIAACSADEDLLDDRRKLALQRRVGQLQKAASSVQPRHDLPQHDAIDEAIGARVAGAVSELSSLLDGTSESHAPAPIADALFRPLLRVPACAQPRTPRYEVAGYEHERSLQRDALFDALMSADSCIASSERVALDIRLRESAVLPSSELISKLSAAKALTPAEVHDAEQELSERQARAKREVGERIATLRLELATLFNLDLRSGERLREALDVLEVMALAIDGQAGDRTAENAGAFIPAREGDRRPGIPADFPQAFEYLSRVQLLGEEVKRQIGQDQRERLDRIAVENPALREVVSEIASSVARRDATTIEDLIASLQSGLPVTGAEFDDRDAFSEFLSDFVDRLAAPGEQLNRGQVDRALLEGAAIGPLDYSGLDEDARRGARQLNDQWRQAENALKPSSAGIREPVSRLMEALGFTKVVLQNESSPIPGKLRTAVLRCTPLEADGWFLPPEFGTLARGTYRVVLAKPEVPDDQIVAEINKVAADGPSLLLLFGRLSRQRRKDLAQLLRTRRLRTLLLDESQVLFLSAKKANRLQSWIACAAPFGYVQPYTTDPGNIPREMFFGRKEEITRIFSKSADGCLVYGGRQLGKSALLNHVRKLFHRQNEGVLVCYRSCDTIGGQSDAAHSIWRVIAGELAPLNAVPAVTSDAEAIVAAVRAWLDIDASRRILMLLDETDQFMSSEARMGYPNLARLKELMVDTSWRFKVVFAGLHNVRRAWKAPNTPLAHLGDPICVGPLNTTAENRAEARRLVVEPMRAAGFEFEQPGLGWDILARVNHYPSLVQVFCKELLTELLRKPQAAARGPRWTIGRSQLFEGVRYRQITEAIRGKFRLTLDLDPRFDLIANVMALLRFRLGDEAVLRKGLEPAVLQQEVLAFWPETLQRLDADAFSALLDEMVDLGVLSRFGPSASRYGLRTAQVAQMLGAVGEIEDQIARIMDMEPRVDYDAALYFRRIDPQDPTSRAPLSDRQLEQLLDPNRPGARVVVAVPSLWNSDFGDALAKVCTSWSKSTSPREVIGFSGSSSAQFRSEIEKAMRRRADTIVIVPSDAKWTDEWLQWVTDRPEVRDGRVVPIFLARPKWLRDHHLSTGSRHTCTTLVPRPWGGQMLRAYLAETDTAILDHPSRRKLLLRGTGGSPKLLIRHCGTLAEKCRTSGAGADSLLNTWSEEQRLDVKDLELDEETVDIFYALEDVEPEELDTLFELLSDVRSRSSEATDFRPALRLFADLGLIEQGDPSAVGIRLTDLGNLFKRSRSDAT